MHTAQSRSKQTVDPLALELSVHAFWPSVPDFWSDFCRYRELHEEFKEKADAIGPKELWIEATFPSTWDIQQHCDGDGAITAFLVLTQYKGDPFTEPVSGTLSLRRLNHLRVLGNSSRAVAVLRQVLPVLATSLTRLEIEATEEGIQLYREILGGTEFSGLHNGCLHWILRRAFETEAALWLRCSPAASTVTSTGDQTMINLAAKLSITRHLIMSRIFPYESDTMATTHPLWAAAAHSVTALGLLLTIGFERETESVQSLFVALCGEGGGSAELHVLSVAGASPRDPAALHSALLGRNRAAVQCLVGWGADVNAVLGGGGDEPATRALHLAAAEGDAELLGLLLEAGADPRARDGAGEEAGAYCRHELQGGIDDAAMLTMLRQAASEWESEGLPPGEEQGEPEAH